MATYGLIDLGSNTIRLCIYEVEDPTRSRFRKKKDFRSLINHKNMVGLASYLDADGMLTDAGVNAATDVLKGHLRRVSYFRCERLEIFATAGLRNCRNRWDVKARLEDAIALPISLLSAREEAHLGVVGAMSAGHLSQGGVVVDMGGGSSEFTYLHDHEEAAFTSLPIGSLSSYASHVAAILPTRDEAIAIASDFRNLLMHETAKGEGDIVGRRGFPAPGTVCPMYALGGSARAVAKLHAALAGTFERPDVLTRADFDRCFTACIEDPKAFAHAALKAAPDRIHTIVPGAVLLAEAMERFGAQELQLCKGGIREGYLIERMLGGSAHR